MSNLFCILLIVLFSNLAIAQGDQLESAKASEPAVLLPPPTPSSPQVPEKKESTLPFGGMFLIGFENWSRVGAADDTKMGLGLSANFGIKLPLDDWNVMAGPHVGAHEWSADYSKKSQSVTDRIYVSMLDSGVDLTLDFGDSYFTLGAGQTLLKSAMVVGGQDIPYAFSGNRYAYQLLQIGFKQDMFLFGLGMTQYSGYAKYCDRVEFNAGLMF